MTDAYDPFSALAAAREAGKPTNIMLDEVGATVEGVVVSVSFGVSEYAAPDGSERVYPILMLRLRDGKMGLLRGWSTALLDLAGCQPGDAVSVTYDGVSDKKEKGKKPPKMFSVFVIRDGQQIFLPKYEPKAAVRAMISDASDLHEPEIF
jgi:hypothetical protein